MSISPKWSFYELTRSLDELDTHGWSHPTGALVPEPSALFDASRRDEMESPSLAMSGTTSVRNRRARGISYHLLTRSKFNLQTIPKYHLLLTSPQTSKYNNDHRSKYQRRRRNIFSVRTSSNSVRLNIPSSSGYFYFIPFSCLRKFHCFEISCQPSLKGHRIFLFGGVESIFQKEDGDSKHNLSASQPGVFW